jgi:hypothetical protein
VTHEEFARFDRHAGCTQSTAEGVTQVMHPLEHSLIDR